jgi:hypothetical protein
MDQNDWIVREYKLTLQGLPEDIDRTVSKLEDADEFAGLELISDKRVEDLEEAESE